LLKFRSLFKAAIVFLAFSSAISVQVQVTTGTVRGAVTDQDGAVVPGATVTITDPKTTTSQTAETGNAGCVGLTPAVQSEVNDHAITISLFRVAVRLLVKDLATDKR